MLNHARTLLYDEEESRDVVAEVFAAIAHEDTVIHTATERTFLLRCVKNRCINIINRMNTRQRVSRLFTMRTLEEGDEDEGENAERLKLFMEQWLSKRAIDILHMRFVEGMKYQEIAESLHISEAAVYKYLSQSLTTIRQHFKAK
jgi:RNA polymerase sigma-70 factor (ECF subfamily)